jgi:hypothetical protein
MYLLTSNNHGRSFSVALLDKWKLNACPMSSAALIDGATGLLAAWETQGQVYFAPLDAKKPQAIAPISATGTAGKSRHPALAVNSRGETVLVWTEGTGWKRGGSLAWQLYDSQGKPMGEKGEAQGVPIWSFAAVIAEKDSNFTVIY